MALIGSITNWGEIQGQINDANGVLTGVISSAELVGGQIVGMRGLKGDKGDTGDTGATGADGFSPSASVSKVGDTATITITDKDGTTTASVYDGEDDVFVAEYSSTRYDDIYSALTQGKIVVLKFDMFIGETWYIPLTNEYSDEMPYSFTFSGMKDETELVATVNSSNSWSYTKRDLQQKLVSGTNIKTINSESLLGSGNIDIQSGDTKNVWYGTSSTNGANKVVTTTSGDFVLEAGNMLRVTFSYDNTYSNATLNVDGTGAKDVKCSGWSAASMWRENEVVDFVYDGTYFQAVNKAAANQYSYGLTILSDSTSSSDSSTAATSKAVKSAYDLANGKQDELISGTNIKTINDESILGSGNIDIQGGGGDVTDVEVNGTSVVDSDGVAEVTVPSNLSDLNNDMDVSDFPNDAGYITSAHEVPSGGSSGQVLAKSSNNDYDVSWASVSGGEIAYCTCTDSASTVAKTATLVNGSFDSLTTGAQVAVKFTYTNTATNPTLNVNNTGAKGIRRGGTTYVGTNTNESWGAGNVVILVYDGTDWQVANWLNTTYTGGTGAEIISGSLALNKVWSPEQIHDGIDGMATATPTASKNSKFDSDAHMNSTDMTTGADSELEDFIDGLNVSGSGVFDVLYNTAPSSPVTSATLSSSIANYKRLKIFGISGDNHFASVEIYNNKANSLTTSLNNGSFSGSALYFKSARIQISGTALTVDRGTNVNIASSFSYSAGTTAMRVYRVEGYYI